MSKLRGTTGLFGKTSFTGCMWIAAVTLAITIGMSAASAAQTFTTLHAFNGSGDGENPESGLTMDRSGNLYGTTSNGGSIYAGGTIFELRRSGSNYLFSTLYIFTGGSDGQGPQSRVVFGPSNILYGTTRQGGSNGCAGSGCGTVFELRPPLSPCKSIQCYWSESVLYRFNGADGERPGLGDVIFDSAGNLYDTTIMGGDNSAGTMYELSRSGGAWSESFLHSFTAAEAHPWSGLTFNGGNLYGTLFDSGTHNAGAVYQFTPSGSGWAESIIYNFTGGSDGGFVYAGVITDADGNLYGATTKVSDGGCKAGTVFELVPAWTFHLLNAFDDSPCNYDGVWDNLTMDSQGNLYGATYADGPYGYGTVFKLTNNHDGSWTYSDLHDFTGNGDDGGLPIATLVVDAAGNIYGTSWTGGHNGHGAVWMITQP